VVQRLFRFACLLLVLVAVRPSQAAEVVVVAAKAGPR